MRDISIQKLHSAISNMRGNFGAEEVDEVKIYYIAYPELLEGFSYFKNTETQPFLAKITGTKQDLAE